MWSKSISVGNVVRNITPPELHCSYSASSGTASPQPRDNLSQPPAYNYFFFLLSLLLVRPSSPRGAVLVACAFDQHISARIGYLQLLSSYLKSRPNRCSFPALQFSFPGLHPSGRFARYPSLVPGSSLPLCRVTPSTWLPWTLLNACRN